MARITARIFELDAMTSIKGTTSHCAWLLDADFEKLANRARFQKMNGYSALIKAGNGLMIHSLRNGNRFVCYEIVQDEDANGYFDAVAHKRYDWDQIAAEKALAVVLG